MHLKHCLSIGEAVQYILQTTPQLRWDHQLDDMYTHLYTPTFLSKHQTPNTLGEIAFRYMEHYELGENFFPFPISIRKGMTKADYIASLLNLYHDYIHALGEYEASDEDEMRLESFLMGNNPLPFAIFFNACMMNKDIHLDKYKHLRDVWSAPIYWVDYERGEKASSLVSLKIEEVSDLPIDELRRNLKITPRTEFADPRNTCGLRKEIPFFK